MLLVLPYLWLCENKNWPHLWEGSPGLTMKGVSDKWAMRLAKEYLKLMKKMYGPKLFEERIANE